MRRAALAVLPALAAAACASPEPPPGGEPDQVPPRLVRVTPEPYAVGDGFDAPAVFVFDERISERLQGVRSLEEAVLVSPETGVVEVDRSGNEIEVSLSGGWRPGNVYRIELRPVLVDLFGNALQEPIELVFSTGPPIPETALAGIVSDRITGAPAPEARVAATRRADSVTYVAVSDTAGFFAMRFVPAGAYDVRAFLDRDRDRVPDFGEARDSAAALLAVDDTVLLALSLLPGDSTPARLARAEAPGPGRVRLVFDDYFDPFETVGGTARLFRMPDSAAVGGGELVHAHTVEERRAAPSEAEPAPDTVEAEPEAPPGAVPDLGVPADTARGGPVATEPPGPLPAQELVLLPADSLEPGTRYVVEVSGLTNIAGVPGGGGAAAFAVPEAPQDPEPADTVPADTVPADPVPADTVPADTVPAGPRPPGPTPGRRR